MKKIERKFRVTICFCTLLLFGFALSGTAKVSAAGSGDFQYEESLNGYFVSAYTGDKNVKSLTIPHVIDGVTMSGIGMNFSDSLEELTQLKTVKIEDGYETLFEFGISPFSLSKIEQIILPSTLKTIDADAFTFCENLKEVSIPDSVTSIGDGAFSGCYSLTTVKLPANLVTIGKLAFEETSLKKLSTIPASVTSIGKDAFKDTGLAEVNVSGDNKNYTSIDGVLYDKGVTKIIFFPPNSKIKTYTVPQTIKDLGRSLEGKNITKVVFHKNIKTIGKYACGGCYKLKEVSIASGTTKIEDYAFWACPSLKKVTIPSTVKSIAKSAFTTSDVAGDEAPIYNATFYVEKNSYAAKALKRFYAKVKLQEKQPGKKESKINISKCKITLSKKEYAYTGSAVKPVPTVKYSGKTLKNKTDYTLSYKNNKKAGKAMITIKGKGKYTGQGKITFTIKEKANKIKISKCKITLSKKKYTYTGKTIKPLLTVKYNGKKLKKGTDYTISYKNNKKAGKATITIKGKGKYTGQSKVTFTITKNGK